MNINGSWQSIDQWNQQVTIICSLCRTTFWIRTYVLSRNTSCKVIRKVHTCIHRKSIFIIVRTRYNTRLVGRGKTQTEISFFTTSGYWYIINITHSGFIEILHIIRICLQSHFISFIICKLLILYRRNLRSPSIQHLYIIHSVTTLCILILEIRQFEYIFKSCWGIHRNKDRWVLFSFLCGNNNCTILCTRSIQCCCSCSLQYIDRFNIIWINIPCTITDINYTISSVRVIGTIVNWKPVNNK